MGRRPPQPDREILQYYERGKERDRLDAARGGGPLERERTREVLARHLPVPPATVVDVGGGAGVHALWLSSLGYHVHLRDPVPLHVEQAEADARERGLSLISAAVGDARAIDLPEASADVVLLLGPLYHLQERADRRTALLEARRILRTGGLLLAAAVSRWSPILGGLAVGLLENPEHLRVVEAAAETGRFDPKPPSGFTRAYFHRPEELREEVSSAGFGVMELVGLEGVGFAFEDFAHRWADPKKREALMEAARLIEEVPELLGLSPHLLLVAQR
jgi:SAM-dependent methyltransferase